jgi:hypothetical protein
MNVRFQEPALEEMMEAAEYYNGRSDGLGTEFLKRVAHTLKSISIFPAAGRTVTANVRRRQVVGFPFGIVYTIQDSIIFIIAVAHDHRRPGYWKYRLK